MALTYGTVTGRFEDTAQGTEPITGSVYFTPEADYILSDDSTVLPAPVSVVLINGAFAFDLVATDDPSLNPVDWTYRVDFNLKQYGYPIKLASFSLKVPAGVTTDLASVAPVASSKGRAITRGPEGPASTVPGPKGDSTYFNVTEFGATGDGTTDDGAALQAAATAATGAVLYFPKGTYKTASTVTLGAGTRVVFEGRSAVLKYTGTTDAFKATEFKGLVIEGGGTIDLSGAGSAAKGIHLYGVWMASIRDMKITQGPANSVGVYIETSLTSGNRHGAYCINIDNIDLLEGAGAAGIQTAQTAGESGVVNRVTHLYINNGWCKGKVNGLYLEQASTVHVNGYVVDGLDSEGDVVGTNGYVIKDSDNVMLRPGELGPVTNFAITFVGTDQQGHILYMPTYAGLAGTNGYLDTSIYQPTVYDRSSTVHKASAGDNNYYSKMESLYSYAKSWHLALKGGGAEVEVMSWGDSAGLVIDGGNGNVTVADNLTVHKSGSTASLGIKSSDGSQQFTLYNTGANGTIESSNGIVLVPATGSTVALGTTDPQLKVQYAGGTYGSVNVSHDDTKGTVTTSTGDLSVGSAANLVLSPNGSITLGKHITPGTATKPPVVIPPGVVTTTPVSGAIETDGVSLYWTDGAGTRYKIALQAI